VGKNDALLLLLLWNVKETFFTFFLFLSRFFKKKFQRFSTFFKNVY